MLCTAVMATATEVSTSVVPCTINWGDVQICELKSVLICRIVHNGIKCKASVKSMAVSYIVLYLE